MPRLWTVSCDYAATGEGGSMLACIVRAEDEEAAVRHFMKTFPGPFFMACEAAPGVVRNRVTEFLFSERALQSFERMADAGNIVGSASFHANFG